MIVYRLEHFSEKLVFDNSIKGNVNTGAYRGNDYNPSKIIGVAMSTGETRSFSTEQHPTPCRDLLLQKKEPYNLTDYVYVFKSMEQLKTWFFNKKGMQELDKIKLARIGVYLVPDEFYIKGQFQSMSKDSEMTLVETRKCNCEL